MIDHYIYKEDILSIINLDYKWKKLQNSKLFITGGSGLIGTFLTDVIMTLNEKKQLNCKVIICGRNKKKARKTFDSYWENPNFHFVAMDINYPIDRTNENLKGCDYIIDLASNTHPVQYATDPVRTITTNVIGLNNVLKFAVEEKVKKVIFASSNEIYGENRGDVKSFDEAYCGYINSNTLRAGYPESKRCAEALCQAYIKQYGLDIVIARVTRTYGPTLKVDDSKAVNQFIKNALAGQDIVLKSDGKQFYSFTYVADTVSALLFLLIYGECGEAYNIAFDQSDITLKDLAGLIAKNTNTKVVFELPDVVENAGFSVVTKAILDSYKLQIKGWKPQYSIEKGVEHTLRILKNNR